MNCTCNYAPLESITIADTVLPYLTVMFSCHKMVVSVENYTFFDRGDLVVVGGVVQEGNWNENVDRADSQDIWNRVTEFFPFIQV